MKKQVLMSLILAGSMVAFSAQAKTAKKNQKAKATTTAANTTAPAAPANTSTVEVSEVQNKGEQGSNSDEITNARMRAEAGSKSKWSVKANLGYQGGSIEKPFDKERPNYRSSTTSQALTYLSGTIGLAYRMTDKDALRFGTGVTMYTPFHNNMDDISSNELADDPTTKVFDVSTPYVEYSRSFRTGSIMHMPSISYSHSTDQYEVDTLQMIGGISLDHAMVADIPGSNFQPGVSVSLGYTMYKDDAQAFDTVDTRGARSDYDIGLYPFLEYAFNDTWSFRTVFGYYTFSHYRDDEAMTFKRLVSYQSMGVGISVTPDIYVYPNVQFIPDDIRADRTNVGLSSTLNVF